MSDTVLAIALGVIQGITEFLPISSSGHLIIFSELTKGETISLTLNVALHMGTLLAILIYFRKDWAALLGGTLKCLRTRDFKHPEFSMMVAILAGTVPAGLVGILFKDDIERIFHHPSATILPLVFVGILLYVVDRFRPQTLSLSGVTWKTGLFVGVAQALALIPGTSRSGITIIAGRWKGLNRGDSARFSFLLGAPAMTGAVILDFKNILNSFSDPVFYIGFVVSFVVGFLTIALLLRMLRRFGFAIFAIYRVLLGIALYLLIT